MTRGVDHTRLPWPHGKSFCAECDEEWPCEVTRLRTELVELRPNSNAWRNDALKAEAALARVRELCEDSMNRRARLHADDVLAAIDGEQT